MFKVGDRVQATETYMEGDEHTIKGTVIDISGSVFPVVIDLDEPIPGVPQGLFYEDELELITDA